MCSNQTAITHKEIHSEGGAFASSKSADKHPETPLFRAYCLQQSEKITYLTKAIIRDHEKLPQVNMMQRDVYEALLKTVLIRHPGYVML